MEIGLVVVVYMAGGLATRMLLRQRLSLENDSPDRSRRQYHLGELMALILVFALGLWLVNLFFDHFDRESQLADIALTVVRALPPTLPWLWGVTQPKLSATALAAIVGITVGIMGLKVTISYAWSGEELTEILMQCSRRAAAYSAGATLNGLVLRGLGFRWRCG